MGLYLCWNFFFSETAKEQIIELNVISDLYSFLDDCSDDVAISILDVLGEFIQDGLLFKLF